MIHTTRSEGNDIPQPKRFKSLLWKFSIVLLLAMLTACNQLASKGILELDGADLTPGKLTFTSAQAATVRELTLYNDDAAPVEITNATVLGTDASSFTLVDTPQFPIIVAPGQQVAFKVRFTPLVERVEQARGKGLASVVLTRYKARLSINKEVIDAMGERNIPVAESKIRELARYEKFVTPAYLEEYEALLKELGLL